MNYVFCMTVTFTVVRFAYSTSLIQLQQTKSHIVPSSFLLIVPEPVYLIASLKRVNLSHNQITEVSTLIG